MNILNRIKENINEPQKILDLINDFEQDKIALVWGYEDILEHAKEHDQKITEDDAREILYIIDHKHDCTMGVSWDVIDCHIDMYLDDKKIV